VERVQGSGEIQELFSSNVVLDTSNSILENVNILLKGCRGWLPVVDGKLQLIIEEDNTVTSEVLDESNIIDIEEITSGSTNDRFNQVTTKYTDPEANWTVQDAI
jgi:exonuclease VII small subunit